MMSNNKPNFVRRNPRTVNKDKRHLVLPIAKDFEEFTKDIEETLKIDPHAHSHKVNKSRLSSFKYAIAGFLHMLRYQQSAHLQLIVTAVVFAIAFWVRVPGIEMAILVLAAGLVWITELLNTSIESAVNLTTTEYHPMARVAKDIGSAGTLIASLVALISGGLIVIPRLLDRL